MVLHPPPVNRSGPGPAQEHVMPEIVKLDILTATDGRIALRLGSEDSGSHTLVVTASQAMDIADGIRKAAENAQQQEAAGHATH